MEILIGLGWLGLLAAGIVVLRRPGRRGNWLEELERRRARDRD